MLTIWFMFDNHTFAKIHSRDREGLVREATKLFQEDGCGSLFVKDEFNATLKMLTVDGKKLTDGTWGVLASEVEQWAAAVVDEITFRKMMT